MFYVTVDKAYLDQLAKALSYSEEATAQALGSAALFHANYVLGAIPEAIKGKLNVQISESSGAGEMEATIKYSMKAGPEGATTTTGQLFMPLSKMGQFSSRSPVVSRGGEQGIFVTGLTTLGRTSIGNYVMQQAQAAVEKGSEVTLEMAVQQVRQDLMDWFSSHGIVYNSSLERFTATQATTLPWGTSVNAGTIIAGAF